MGRWPKWKKEAHEAYEKEQKLIDYTKPFYYDKFGTKYTVKDSHALWEEMATSEEKGLDCYELQMQIRELEKKLNSAPYVLKMLISD
jgi:hypothetical protein